MKGLLYKDFRMILVSFRVLPFIVFVLLGGSMFTDVSAFWSVYAMFMGSLLVSSMQNMDETGRWCTYCDTFPLRRSDIVKEKYVLALICAAVIILVYAVLRLVGALFGRGIADLGITCFGMSLVGIVSSAMTLMTSFVFGPQKGAVARLVVIIAVVSICMGLMNYAPAVLDGLAGLSPALLLLICCAVPLLFAGLCFRISCAVFEKRTLQ